MKVLIVESIYVDQNATKYLKGDEVDVPKEIGLRLIEIGHAKEIVKKGK